MTTYPAEITVQDYARMRAEGVPHVLLDVREDAEVAMACLSGSIHIPMGEITARHGELPQDRPIIVQCRSGARSGVVTQQLRHFGFERVANLQGGILAWSREIDPSLQIR